MHLDEPFPLEAVPSRVGHVLLREFKGRCPSVREVDQIPDKHWLTAPGVGRTTLQVIRSITSAVVQHQGSHAASHSLPDAELLRRLEGLQEELRWVAGQLKALVLRDARRRPQRQQHSRRSRNANANPGHPSGGFEASHHPNDQDHVA